MNPERLVSIRLGAGFRLVTQPMAVAMDWLGERTSYQNFVPPGTGRVWHAVWAIVPLDWDFMPAEHHAMSLFRNEITNRIAAEPVGSQDALLDGVAAILGRSHTRRIIPSTTSPGDTP